MRAILPAIYDKHEGVCTRLTASRGPIDLAPIRI
jgi:hypothetical protein